MRIIAYTADADVLCPDCASKTYGVAALGVCPSCHHYLGFPRHGYGICPDCQWESGGLTDGEGNEVHPIFFLDSPEFGLCCGQCREELCA